MPASSSPAPSLTIDEGSSGTYTVKLNRAPTANVTVTVGGASGEVSVTGSPLTFTTGNWSTAQTVTVSAGEDDDTVNDSATLTHTAGSTDTNYNSASPGAPAAIRNIESVEVTVRDNDTPPPPVNNPVVREAPSVPGTPTGVVSTAGSSSAGNAQVTLTWPNPGDATISEVAGPVAGSGRPLRRPA